MSDSSSDLEPNGRSAAGVVVVCEGGPAAGLTRTLGPGRHVVGRAPSAAIRIADRAMEPHHAILDVDPDGVRLLQLSGRVPCRVDGAPLGTGATGAPVRPGAIVVVGSSRLRVGDDPEVDAATRPEPNPCGRPEMIDDAAAWVRLPAEAAEPAELAGRGGLAIGSAVLTVLTAAALAVRSSGTAGRWLLVALVAGAATVTVVVLGRRTAARRRALAVERAALVQLEGDLVARRASWLVARRTRAPGLMGAVAVLKGSAAAPDHTSVDGSMFVVSLGDAPDRWEPMPVAASGAPSAAALALLAQLAPVEQAPVEAELGPGATVTISGPGAGGVARSLVIQLASFVPPEQVRIEVGADPPPWVSSLPHAAASDGGDGRHVVAVVDRRDLVGRPPDVVRDAVGCEASAALLLVDEDGVATNGHTARLDLTVLGTGRWRAGPDVVSTRDVHPAGLDADTAARLVALIAERHPVPGAVAPVGLAELARGRDRGPLDDPIEVAATWRTGSGAAEAWIGRDAFGLVTVDLDEVTGPVIVVADAAETVAGVVATFVCSLAATVSPEALQLTVVRTRGPNDPPPAWEELPHVVQVLDVDDREGLIELAASLFDAVEGGDRRSVRRLLVLDDDGAAAGPLAAALAMVLERGPAAGVHVLLERRLPSSRRTPAALVDVALEDPTALRIVARVEDAGLARRAGGDTRPARLGPDAAIVRQPGGSSGLVRLPVSEAGGWDELGLLAGAIRHAGALSGSTPTW